MILNTFLKLQKRLAAVVLSGSIVAASPSARAVDGCGEPTTPNARAAATFRIFDATLYQRKPDLSAYGIEPLTVHYGEMWKGPKHYPEVPEEDTLKALAHRHRPGKLPVVLDVEHWPVKGDPAEVGESLAKLRALLARFRNQAPDKQFGFYALLPMRDYWRAIKGPQSPEYQAWQKDNDSIKSLERDVDVLFPSIYTFYDDQEGWRKYAKAQICEARRMSAKPVYVFLWPEFHDSNQRLKGTYVSAQYWRMQLETVRSSADGAVIWGGYDTQQRRPREWNDGAGWWQETREFAKNLR